MSEIHKVIRDLHERISALEAEYACEDSEKTRLGFGTGFTSHGHTSVPPSDAASNLIFNACEAVIDYFSKNYVVSSGFDFITDRKLNGEMRKCLCTYIKCKKVATARYVPTMLVPNLNSKSIACHVYIFNYEKGDTRKYDIEMLFAKDKQFNQIVRADIYPSEDNTYQNLKAIMIRHFKEKLRAAMDVVTA